MKVVVLGAGIGGKLASIGIKTSYPETDVVLVGPEDNSYPGGLFYFNEAIPGIAEKEINVNYELLGNLDEDSFKRYQIKSRGRYDENIKVSSFDKVGKTEKGYLLSSSLDPRDYGVSWLKQYCTLINPKEKEVKSETRRISYDLLILTIPYFVSYKMITGQNIKDSLEYIPVFVKETSAGLPKETVDTIEVEYDLTDSPFYRHSRLISKYIVIETNSESIQEIENYERKLIPGKILPIKDKSILPDVLENKYPEIKFLGRYARWDYHYLVTDTYYDAIRFVYMNN